MSEYSVLSSIRTDGLESRINARRQELADLDALYRSLPRELSPEADRALWNLLMNQRIG